MPIFRTRIFLEETYGDVCKKLQENWRNGWSREGIKAAMIVHQIPEAAIDACCDNDFKLWFHDFDIEE